MKPALSVDDDLPLASARDVEVDAVGDDSVVERVGRGDAVVDRAARARDVARDDVARDVAGHVDRVAAEAADHARQEPGRGREDVDRVVALEGVDLEHLDVRVRDLEAGAEDALRRDDDVVGELGAEHDDLVEAVAAVDRDGRVDVVLHLVVPSAGADVGLGGGREAVGQPRLRDLVGRVDPDDVAVVGGGRGRRVAVGAGAVVGLRLRERERADHEQVVVVAALEPQRRVVRVDGEDVVARAAGRDERLRNPGAQPAARRGDRREDVVRAERAAARVPGRRAGVIERVALGAVDLADLEGVVAEAAVERRDRAVVVDGEVVVAGLAVDDQATVDRGVVVDALDVLVALRQRCRWGRTS